MSNAIALPTVAELLKLRVADPFVVNTWFAEPSDEGNVNVSAKSFKF
jgi:hypothetical protein